MKKKNEAVETVLCERVLSAEEVACISVQIQQELEAYIDPVKREYLPRFFKTGKGQYGEGDKVSGSGGTQHPAGGKAAQARTFWGNGSLASE